MRCSERRRGSSLVETIVALVLLAGSLLLVTALLHRSNRYQQRSESLLEAGALADKVMGDIRAWATNPSNYSSNWAPYNNQRITDPDFPNLEAVVDVQVGGMKVFSPDNPTELGRGNPREMQQGSVSVRIQAARDVTSSVGRITIWSTVAPPTPVSRPDRLPHVQVSGSGGGPMTFNETRGFTAEAFDGLGRKLPPCCFEWRVRSGSGRAEGGAQSRDGRSYSITHNVMRDTDTDPPVPEAAWGDVSVEADARIMGKVYTGSLGVTLSPL